MWQILSSSDVKAGPCLNAMFGRLLTSCVRNSSLTVVVGLLSRCGRVLFSNWQVGDSSMVVMRRGSFSSCEVQEAPVYLWQGDSSLTVVVWLPSRCGRVLFSNWEVGDSSMVVMRRGIFFQL